MQLIDIGVNLTHKTFTGKIDNIIDRAIDADVEHIIVTGTDLKSSINSADLANKYNMLSSTAGVHPHNAKTFNVDCYNKLKTLINSNECIVAVGECGLDFNRNFSSIKEQESAFINQIQLSLELSKPLFLHERDAAKRFSEIISKTGITGVVHCFTGNKDDLKVYLDSGLYIGITGWICDDKRNASLKDAVSYIPSDRLMIETDAPFLLPKNLNASFNEPAYLIEVLKRISYYMKIDKDELAKITTENAKKMFSIDL